MSGIINHLLCYIPKALGIGSVHFLTKKPLINFEIMNEKIERIYTHWLEMSNKDFETMQHLYQSGDMHWSLFLGHLVLEKLFKAYLVKQTNNDAPFTHDLSRLAHAASLDFSTEHLDWLDTITTFNINARYDDYKQAFYKKCTPEFTEDWLAKIKTLQQWIKEKLKT